MARIMFGMSRFAKESALIFLLTACGPSAPEYHPAEQTRAGTPAESKPKTMETAARTERPEANGNTTSTPADAKTPEPAPLAPPRTLPNAAEKTAMTNLYAAPNNQGGCAGCHGALNASAKKGRTAQQITSAQTILQHRTVAAANKWPKDTADTTNDGVDNAQLYLSALVEILK
ncbi:MAG TPA: hypothetical protein VFO10_05060 [Oligoflexus sp.]|uniref:hypothetical protein n=1 Tax=Oligoflexus sp. TaxID=1971216 RepID=UPI002D7F49DA|nr:hypothetical protein [Oligoflexus sp.]HET9236594.1 hypothetical protein [Oligoflexus sp.]